MTDKIICHRHCPPGGHGGGKAALLVVLAVVAACLYAAARKAAPAIDTAAHTALHVLEIAAITVASGAGLAGLGWLAHKRVQAAEARADTPALLRVYPAVTSSTAQALSAPRAQAIEAPKPHQHETSGVADVAAPAYCTQEES
jgi:hypothetical protein